MHRRIKSIIWPSKLPLNFFDVCAAYLSPRLRDDGPLLRVWVSFLARHVLSAPFAQVFCAGGKTGGGPGRFGLTSSPGSSLQHILSSRGAGVQGLFLNPAGKVLGGRAVASRMADRIARSLSHAQEILKLVPSAPRLCVPTCAPWA